MISDVFGINSALVSSDKQSQKYVHDRNIPARAATETVASQTQALYTFDKPAAPKKKGNRVHTLTSRMQALSLHDKTNPPYEERLAHVLFDRSLDSLQHESLFSTKKSQVLKSAAPAAEKRRAIPLQPERRLDVPDVVDDFYCHALDWSQQNCVAVNLRDTFVYNYETRDHEKYESAGDLPIFKVAVIW